MTGLEDRVEVSTFHSFAYRLLRSFGVLSAATVAPPTLQSVAEAKLFGHDKARLSYDDLVPGCLIVLADDRVASLVARRWPLIICDEFQDTSPSQWALLVKLALRARLLVLADNNQLIYTFVDGVSPERLRHAVDTADRVVELEATSHRDPSGVIPALASAIRRRQFDDAAVTTALASGRLRIRRSVQDDDIAHVVREEIDRSWQRGSRSFGIFGHSNQGVAELSSELDECGIRHALVGLPEAAGEALAAMNVLTRYGAREVDERDVNIALATFLTACSRGAAAPALAVALATGDALPSTLAERLAHLRVALIEAGEVDVETLAGVALTAWRPLGILAGNGPWRQAAPAFVSSARNAARSTQTLPAQLEQLAAAIDRLRISSFLDSRRRRLPRVQLMNFHQTKGREADTVILVYRDGDYLAPNSATEPFAVPSRLLYVAFSRARKDVIAILGSDPHPLVAPLAML